MTIITFPYPDYENLGVAYLMSACLAEGHKVEYVHYRNFHTLFETRFELDVDAVAHSIIEKGTQIAAFSSTTDNFRTQLKLAEAVKGKCPDILCIFGGVHVTAVPEKVLQNAAVDCVALGEADRSLCELLGALTKNNEKLCLPDNPVPGIVCKKDSKWVGAFDLPEYPDLDTRPFPHKAPFFRQMPEAKAAYLIMTSRGCPYNCDFCYNSSAFLRNRKKEMLRRRSVDNVISELKWAHDNFSPQSIWFVDDCFTTDTNWLASFCKRYKSEIHLPFTCMAHPMQINDAVAEILKDAGCYSLELGVQSLSEAVCKAINRKGKKQHVIDAITCLKKHDILVAIDHILGLPGDSVKIQEESILFYNEQRPFWVYPFWLTYFPKTKITETALQKGFIDDRDVDRLEQGYSGGEGLMLTSGHVKDKEWYLGIAFLLNWFPLLPKPIVSFLVKSRRYNIFRIKNHFLCVLVPRGIRSFHPKFVRRGYHLKVLADLYSESLKRLLSRVQNRVKEKIWTRA